MFPEKPEHHPISLVFIARSVTVGGKEEKEGHGAGRSTEANEWGMKTQFPLLRPGGEVLVEKPLPLSRNFGLSPGKAQSLALTGSWAQAPGQTRTAPNTTLPLQEGPAGEEGRDGLLAAYDMRTVQFLLFLKAPGCRGTLWDQSSSGPRCCKVQPGAGAHRWPARDQPERKPRPRN